MERKAKCMDSDKFERAHKAIESSRYDEIKERGKVTTRLALGAETERALYRIPLSSYRTLV